jgi:hypothetical protein
MYPTLIIVIVALRRSELDSSASGLKIARSTPARVSGRETLSLNFATNSGHGLDGAGVSEVSSATNGATESPDRRFGEKDKGSGDVEEALERFNDVV